MRVISAHTIQRILVISVLISKYTDKVFSLRVKLQSRPLPRQYTYIQYILNSAHSIMTPLKRHNFRSIYALFFHVKSFSKSAIISIKIGADFLFTHSLLLDAHA